MKRFKRVKDETTDSSVYKKACQRFLKCAVCPPNKRCNKKCYKKYNVKKPKYKDKR